MKIQQRNPYVLNITFQKKNKSNFQKNSQTRLLPFSRRYLVYRKFSTDIEILYDNTTDEIPNKRIFLAQTK